MKNLTTQITVKNFDLMTIQEIVTIIINAHKSKSITLPLKYGKLIYTLEIDYVDKTSYYVNLCYKYNNKKYLVCSWFYWVEHNILM